MGQKEGGTKRRDGEKIMETFEGFEGLRIAVKQQYAFGMLIVSFSDGSQKMYDAFKLGCKWLKMSNDTFYSIYGFSFNPHNIPGLYERCMKEVYQNDY